MFPKVALSAFWKRQRKMVHWFAHLDRSADGASHQARGPFLFSAHIKRALISTVALPVLFWAAPSFAQDAEVVGSSDTSLEVSGRASAVIGVSDDDTTTDVDAKVKVKGAKFLDNGLEIGGVVEARLDGDIPQQYWSGGRYSGFTSGGARGLGLLDGDVYLQSAYAYARGGFGILSIGRDNGIASQLAVTSPTIFSAIGVNDWKSDPSGLNDVHTINDFSGYSTKLTYQPPANFLGGVLGGLQVGFSYAPELSECGDELCAPVSGFATPTAIATIPGTALNIQSGWENVLETALYYEKGIALGTDRLTLGVGASYVSAEENGNTLDVLDIEDYESYALGVNVNYGGITFGGSVKNTNSGFSEDEDDGYLAFDAGITYETGQWGFMLGYGASDAARATESPLVDPNFYRETETTQAGISYAISNGLTLGAAAQFVDSEQFEGIEAQEESTTLIFESNIKF